MINQLFISRIYYSVFAEIQSISILMDDSKLADKLYILWLCESYCWFWIYKERLLVQEGMSSYEEADDSQLDRSKVRRQCDRHRPNRDRSHRMKCGIASSTPEFLLKKLAILIFICLPDFHLFISVGMEWSSWGQFKECTAYFSKII